MIAALPVLEFAATKLSVLRGDRVTPIFLNQVRRYRPVKERRHAWRSHQEIG